MSAITIRNLPEGVHAGLRRLAAARGQSVEAFVRNILADAVQIPAAPGRTGRAQGMAEANFLWNMPGAAPAPPTELWGAMKGSAHVPAGTDLTTPLDEAWEAAN